MPYLPNFHGLSLPPVLCGLLALSALSGCSPAEKPCPARGWVSDKCAPVGEFPYAGKVLYIPNTPPNKYRWYGKVTYYPDRKQTVSPNLAFYWRTGQAAEGNEHGWPKRREDLVLFSLTYDDSINAPKNVQELVQQKRVKRALEPGSLPPGLPYSPPRGLAPFTELPSRSYLLFFSEIEPSVILRCPPPIDFTGRYVPDCTGIFFPREGLMVEYHLSPYELARWQPIQAALTTLITSWSATSANN